LFAGKMWFVPLAQSQAGSNSQLMLKNFSVESFAYGPNGTSKTAKIILAVSP
jgi:hypothetical protein